MHSLGPIEIEPLTKVNEGSGHPCTGVNAVQGILKRYSYLSQHRHSILTGSVHES